MVSVLTRKSTVGAELSAWTDGDPSNQIWVWRTRKGHMGPGITLEFEGVKSEVAISHQHRESSGQQVFIDES